MRDTATIGIVSPGAMGSALAQCWIAGGTRVVATMYGRSERTRQLATGLELLPNLADVVAAANIIVSVVPPARAEQAASDIAASAFQRGVRPLVVDLNATAPTTVGQIADLLSKAGCGLVDGSISGPPPSEGSDTLVYLSGPQAAHVASLPMPMPNVEVHVLGERIGTASAVKMCTASVYKGFAALLSQALQTAHHHQVTETVLADLVRDFPVHVDRAAQLLAMAASKSDRFVGEMRQIAQTQAAAGASRELFEAMAAVYERICRSELAKLTPEQASSAEDLNVVLTELARRSS
jgi:3-hydroxyisobutyrate dehydrogenase-like beta-hydroxyacid dehydrogenase